MKEIDRIEEDSEKYEEDSDDDEYERTNPNLPVQDTLVKRVFFREGIQEEANSLRKERE